jgi:hypothetical protein
MADRYWVGGTGSWTNSSTTNWSTSSGGASGASAPTTSDDVYFDANSNVGTGSFTVTTSSTPNCRNLTIQSLDGAMTLAGTTNLTVAGSIFFSGSNLTYTRTGDLVLAPTSNSFVTTNGVSLASGGVVINTTGASTTTLGSSLTCAGFTVTDGAFITNNWNLTCTFFSSTGSATRSITLGTSTIACSSSFALSSTNLTFSGASSDIVLSGGSVFFTGAGQTFGTVRFTNNSASIPALTISGANTFSSLRLCDNTRTVVQPFIFRITATQTCTTNFICRTTVANSRIMVIGSDASGPITISTPVATLQNVDFGWINGAGAAAPFTGTRIGDLSGNTNITTSAPKTVYWSAVGGGNYTDTAWALSSGGTPNADNFPLPQDTAVVENTGLNVSATITIPASCAFNGIDTSTRTNAATLAVASTSTYCFGTIYNFSSPNVTFPVVGNFFYFSSPTTQQVWLPTGTNNFTPILYTNFSTSYDTTNLTYRGTLKFMNSGRLGGANNFVLYHASGTLDVNGQTIELTGSAATIRFNNSGSASQFLQWNFNGGTVDVTANPTNSYALYFDSNSPYYIKFDSALNAGGFRIMPTGTNTAITYLRMPPFAVTTIGVVPPNIELRSVTNLSGNFRQFYFVDLGTFHVNNFVTSITAAADAGSSGPFAYINTSGHMIVSGNFTVCRRTRVQHFSTFVICLANNAFSLPSQANISVESNSANVNIYPAVYFGYDIYYSQNRLNTSYVVSQSSAAGSTGFTWSPCIFYFFGGTLNLNGNRIPIDRFFYNGPGPCTLVSGTNGTIASNFTSTTVSDYAWNVNTSTANFNITGNAYLQCTANNAISFNVLNSSNTGLSINRSAGTGNVYISGNVRDYANTAASPVPSNSFSLYGNLTMPVSGQSNSAITITCLGGDTQTITTNGANCNYQINISKTVGTKVILAQNTTVASSGRIILTQGELDLNNFNLTIQTTNGIQTAAGAAKRIYLGSGTITAAYFDVSVDSADVTVTPGTSTIIMSNGVSSSQFLGGGKTYNVLRKAGSGILTIAQSNTFATLENDQTGTQGTIRLINATTQTVTGSVNLSGNSASRLVIDSNSAGAQGSLYIAPDATVDSDWLNIRDSNATGTKYWYAGNNSLNTSNNTGWIFCGAKDQNFVSFFS